jgi:CheY-like chemotaxis protein
VLSDVMMPIMSGLELALAMAQQPRYRDIPVVLVSAAVPEALTRATPHAA